jgi:hypothetical protein
MILKVLCFCSLFAFCLPATALDIEALRLKFYESINEKSAAKKFLEELEKIDKGDYPLIIGYRAAVKMIMAKHTLNPIYKYIYFVEGKKLLEAAVSKDSNNIELRFIRLSIQTNVPAFLGYKSELEKDKDFVRANLKKLNIHKKSNETLIKYIQRFLDSH